MLTLIIQVIWKRLYKDSSSQEGGTLYQLKNLINRTNLPTKPKNNVNATKDILTVVRIGHVIAAAIEHFHLDGMNDEHFPEEELPHDFNSMSTCDAFHRMVKKL